MGAQVMLRGDGEHFADGLERPEDATVAVEGADHRARHLSGATGLVIDRVRGPVEQDLVTPGTDVQAQGDLIAHGSGGEKESRLLPQHSGHARCRRLPASPGSPGGT